MAEQMFALRAAIAAVAECSSRDLRALDDGTIDRTLRDLTTLGQRVDGLCTHLVAEQRRRLSPAARRRHGRALREGCGLAGGEVRRLLASADAVESLPPCAGAALAAGEVSTGHLRVLHEGGDELDDETKAALVIAARTEDVDAFRSRVLAAVNAADAASAAKRAARQHRCRNASLRTADDGMEELRARFSPVEGALVRSALDRAVDELWRSEHPQRAASVLDRPEYGTRLADALAHICRTFLAGNTEGARPAAPLLSVLVDQHTLAGHESATPDAQDGSVCQTDWGVALAPETARRLACDAEVIAMLFGRGDAPTRLGRRRRFPTAEQRAAVVARDRRCRFPGCGRVPAWCQVHHIEHWARGGATDLSNMILLCHHHHHLVHEGGWTMQGDADVPGALVVRTPIGVVHDPLRAGPSP